MLDHLRDGDTVVIGKLDRRSRSLKDVPYIMERIAKVCASFQAITENTDPTTQPAHDDADGRGLRRVRTRHDTGADLRRSRRRPSRRPHWRAAKETWF